MISEYKLRIFEDVKEIIFKYMEVDFPVTDTGVALYDAYKLNIMLSDGLAAIVSDRNEIYNSFSGDLFFFRPSEIHHGRILRQGIHRYIEILIPTEYFPNFKSYNALFNDNTETRTNLISPAPKERADILTLAEAITADIQNKADDISLLSHFIKLLSICGNLYEQKEMCNANQNIPATLLAATDFIRNEYAQDLKITDIAASVGCSPSYLSRIFKKHFGKSPYRYLTEYRLFAAEKLLKKGSSITDAASMSGFCDASTFIKCFKKAFGTTPLKYKASHNSHA